MTHEGVQAPARVTGERVASPSDGFNPVRQRHAAAYRLGAELLPPGRTLDLGCGTGHSSHLLAPRETVGVDLDAEALAGQDRETHVADMADLPFGDATFAGVISVQSIEHVPDPDPVLREVARVLEPAGTALFVTPNRLMMARPEEVVNPYHYVEYSPDELREACARRFEHVEMRGLFGSERYTQLFEEQRERLERVLGKDPLRLRRFAPRRLRQRFNDWHLERSRAGANPRAAAISIDDFEVRDTHLDSAIDVVAICASPRR